VHPGGGSVWRRPVVRTIGGKAFMKEEIRKILTTLGEDPEREGLKETPRRVDESLRFLTGGYKVDTEALVKKALFTEDNRDMIVVKNIEVYSLCEHHLLPFFGRCHVGYIPHGKVVGLSKIPRIVDAFAKRLQLQERLTDQIAGTLWKHLEPTGLGVVIEAKHLCMMMRGVQKQDSEMVTSSMLGSFRLNSKTRAEFLSFIRSNSAL
jgi:GTP cyclohydrolase I